MNLLSIIIIIDQIEDKDGVTPPNTKGNEEYTQWLQNFLREAVAKVTDTNLSRSLSTVKDYLEVRMYIEMYILSDLCTSFHL